MFVGFEITGVVCLCKSYFSSCFELFVLCFSDVRSSIVGWSERFDVAQKLLSLLNSYTPKEVRQSCLGKA